MLVAGGAGFIGSHVCEALLDAGHDVVAVDNFLTGDRANVEHLLGQDRFSLVEHDICRSPVPVEGPLSLVMDLASPASPVDFIRLSLEIMEIGSVGTRNLLELARAHQARFLLSSTSEVYGDPLVHPQPESYRGNVDPIGPRSCYDEAKRFSEALAMAYQRRYGLEVRIARIFNTYGPRMRPDDGRVVTNFVMAALRGQPLTLYGPGSQTRSFCYVDDEVRGLLALAWGPVSGPVNIGSPDEISIRQLAEVICELTGSDSSIVDIPMPDERLGDPAVRQPDISLARSTLGWSPTIDLREGLARMIPWYRAYLSAPSG